MKNEHIELPSHVLKEIEYAWGKDRNDQASNIVDAKRKFEEITGYGLKMYWLGRVDKLNPNNRKVFQWITENFVSEDLQNKHPIENIFDVKFKGEDYPQLLKLTLDKLWDSYVQSPNNGLPQPAEPNKGFSLKKLFKR